MTFQQALADYSAAHIIAALGCPRGTAYDWLDGRREPPEWQQAHWLALLRRSTPKQGNKTLMPSHADEGKGRGKAKGRHGRHS